MDRVHDQYPAVAIHGTSAAVLAAALAASCDQLMRGILLLDATWCVLYANLSAREVLTAGDAVSQRSDRLILLDRRQQARLDQYGARLEEPTDGESDGGALVLQLDRRSGLPAYRVMVKRLAPLVVPATESVFLVMIFDPSASRRISAEVLIQLYELTPSEAAIAVQLFEGGNVSAIALGTCHSPNTIRTHLRAIFRKCQVTSQAQLLQLLALGPRR